MMERLRVLADRVDALSLRERVFLFLSILACVLAVADVVLISPAQTRHLLLTKQFAAQNDELARLRDELKATSTTPGTGGRVREELMQVRLQLEQTEQEIAGLPVAAASAQPLQQVLAQFLRRHEGLNLVRTLTLPTLSPGAKRTDGSTAQVLDRQRLELTVSGPYPQLVRYVETLEKSLPALRWAVMNVKSESQPTELTLQVSLLTRGQ